MKEHELYKRKSTLTLNEFHTKQNIQPNPLRKGKDNNNINGNNNDVRNNNKIINSNDNKQHTQQKHHER